MNRIEMSIRVALAMGGIMLIMGAALCTATIYGCMFLLVGAITIAASCIGMNR